MSLFSWWERPTYNCGFLYQQSS